MVFELADFLLIFSLSRKLELDCVLLFLLPSLVLRSEWDLDFWTFWKSENVVLSGLNIFEDASDASLFSICSLFFMIFVLLGNFFLLLPKKRREA